MTEKFWAAMLWHIGKIWYMRLRKHLENQIRRYLDRYFRLGRHRPVVIGLANVRWAPTLTRDIRLEREWYHFAHIEEVTTAAV